MQRLRFEGRGLVLSPPDFTLTDWPERMNKAGLNVVGLHVTGGPPSVLTAFLATDQGQELLDRFHSLGIEIEYEVHAFAELLPREMFGRDPELFRMNENGDRVADWNLCPSNPRALEIVGERAVALSKVLTPTTHRYYLWSDDGKPWCHCSKCRGLNDADQMLLTANAVLRALRQWDPLARAAGLAYHATLTPPTQVKPDDGVFLEFAPIERRWDRPITDRAVETHARLMDALDAAIETYGIDEHAQVLEYWMDASRHSGWKRPAVKIPWHPDVVEADVEYYGSKGFRRITSFGCYLDKEYIAMHGEPPVSEYGRILLGDQE